ncbi:1-aminocyclopropane-1-carboxylate deaminase/D-cysteine desulfhydrase [Elizabethkingia anophelis]|uniref:1-aminocyclopropane-1-carboxylate deaminase/D-cysteine desulfhydrase n=1 Tax=Elizabethkingia anophelis TaxID=1117645 RepID=UPI00099A73E0|nr:pyridoxal-phosphate dependent enzyme [Elizabethkingia anophelis]MCT3648135.1 1-aminocyclopropane-1-carboxylate deaminase/D-cysteine desulfhydrase [Elizabethkingia anophelis]MCT3693800.1 1-aminocyclopropane-1-carboxylate deaminase/D-cysteine desulfhydrase [Elizabethkingia anophelis]MCT3805429.1 1-aminocyclopropane-1-carboxylate deaminase/D-cysteine desulfhydrase [Elizabethkingia anophelis]MCT3812613.1 1-aminocyclopropane-1-carboxylate deaminase/D-cysteine desulfhydrase [Elizabethkingia anophe
MLTLPKTEIPIQKIKSGDVEIFLKREDLIHPDISGNKYWKLFYNVNHYLNQKIEKPFIITFGGAFSNHIATVAAFGRIFSIPTMGIIRGEELEARFLENVTLRKAYENGMDFRFVSRTDYRDKDAITEKLWKEFPEALIVPEGGSNLQAVEGVKFMLTEQTKDFDYLCTAVGTGGSIAGISKYAEENQKVIGFTVVRDVSLEQRIRELNTKNNFNLIEADYGGYGKISDEIVRFINDFWKQYNIPLDPVYTGKMMMRLFQLVEEGFFPAGSRILAFHTGGLQGIEGANQLLRNKNRNTIEIRL